MDTEQPFHSMNHNQIFMDKSWMTLERDHQRYIEGITNFIAFVRCARPGELLHICPCKRCKLYGERLTLDRMYIHLSRHGMMKEYTKWTLHGEVNEDPSLYMLRQQYISNVNGETSYASGISGIQHMIYNAFPFQDFNDTDHIEDMEINDDDVDSIGRDAYEKYQRLMQKAQTPLFAGSKKTLLEAILLSMQAKVENRWSDKSFNDHLTLCKVLLPTENCYPNSYQEVKKVLKDLGMGYQVIHACEYACVLFYKEYKDLVSCPVCGESRYTKDEGVSKIPRRTVRYFPLTPRLQRLYMAPHVAKEMRWHGERVLSDGDLRHPSDGEEWKSFDKKFPEFASEVRNIRLGLATDGFNPFGGSAPHSTWPVIVMPYNLPPSMCMKKEFNMLTLLISGPKSPGKCLNVFMRPLIDELKNLWEVGSPTHDSHDGSQFQMKAAVMWTISDFPGLSMLGGIKVKGYKACPLCLDEIDVARLGGTMTYQGHRRWLHRDHPWRNAANKFNGEVETRDAPLSLSGTEIFQQIVSYNYPTLSKHPSFLTKSATGVCWTHVSIFYELPYWKTFSQPYSLDVMHIEKNVFDNIIGTILGIQGKTRDGPKARQGLKEQGVRSNMWDDGEGSSSRIHKVLKAPYTVLPDNKIKILEMIRDSQYPHGYAGSLRNKINLDDKKFIGLKTHDCHVMFQRLLPVFIRPYLPNHIVEPLVSLSHWFQKLCCRELKKEDVLQLKVQIVTILCKLERIFPPAFFTIMIHLMIHLPQQVELKGPVHFSWMYPIERQLGEYKKYVRNKRYPEGCIAEQYIAQECVTYCKLYLIDNSKEDGNGGFSGVIPYRISVVSNLVKPTRYIPSKRLSRSEMAIAHWCVIDNCEEARHFVHSHCAKFYADHPYSHDAARINDFHPFFLNWMNILQSSKSQSYARELHILAYQPQTHCGYSQCFVNGVKFVIWECDQKLKTQNSGVMVETGDQNYYGILENVIELRYSEGMSVILFKCKWFNTDPKISGSTKIDHGLLSIDTSTSWYEDSPYCLAIFAKQVFYLNDPKCGDDWKIVNVVSHRGIYSDNSLARHDNVLSGTRFAQTPQAYQENTPMNVHVSPDGNHNDVNFLPFINPQPSTGECSRLHHLGDYESDEEEEDESEEEKVENEDEEDESDDEIVEHKDEDDYEDEDEDEDVV